MEFTLFLVAMIAIFAQDMEAAGTTTKATTPAGGQNTTMGTAGGAQIKTSPTKMASNTKPIACGGCNKPPGCKCGAVGHAPTDRFCDNKGNLYGNDCYAILASCQDSSITYGSRSFTEQGKKCTIKG